MVKKTVKKSVKKAKPKIKKTKSSPKKAMPTGRQEKPIGVITHYYGGIDVGIIKFNKSVKAGTEVEIRGATTDFSQKLNSMQYDHKPIETAPKGKEVGVKLEDKVREGDEVYEVKVK
ncbi:MAG: translation elongation factor-like protein [Patescibacteria group bacterium]